MRSSSSTPPGSPGPPDVVAPAQRRRIRSQLLRWFDRHKRDLPWRRSRDPYSIWISEIMLQQTRVATATPYYERFLRRFPDVRALAAAPLDVVLWHWAGLGYYGRARNLHAAACEVVEQWNGEMPREPQALRSLPGIGQYTAGAVASIAFGHRVAAVDGNVARVLARLFAADRSPPDWAPVARQLVPRQRAGDFNQALIELGATICSPSQPDCRACPLARECRAREHQRVADFPQRRARARPQQRYVACAIVQRGSKQLMVKHGNDDLLGGLWNFPMFEITAPPHRLDNRQIAHTCRRQLASQLGVSAKVTRPLPRLVHELTHIHLHVQPLVLRFVAGRAAQGRPLGRFDAARFVDHRACEDLAMSALAQKIRRSFLQADS